MEERTTLWEKIKQQLNSIAIAPNIYIVYKDMEWRETLWKELMKNTNSINQISRIYNITNYRNKGEILFCNAGRITLLGINNLFRGTGPTILFFQQGVTQKDYEQVILDSYCRKAYSVESFNSPIVSIN